MWLHLFLGLVLIAAQARAAGRAGHDRLSATGLALLFVDPKPDLPLGMLHRVSFIAWALTALHVLGHLPEILQVPSALDALRRR